VEKDPEKGKELKVQSIEGLNTMAEDPYALAALGAMALRGEGVVKDMKKAAKLYRKSADLGYAPAQLLYSMMLTKGVGVSTDASAARKYASMAEEQNYHP
jgi:TPR repeat protein